MNFRISVIIFLLTIISFTRPMSVFAGDRGNLSISEREIIERLTSLEEGQKSIQNQINGIQNQINGIQNQINGIQNQINGLRNLILGGFVVVFAGIFSLIGFVIWDRRSAISPVINRTREIEDQERLILRAMKDYALKEPKMSEVLKSLGLL